MKIKFLIITFLFFSCNKEETTTHSFILKNKSNYHIELDGVFNGTKRGVSMNSKTEDETSATSFGKENIPLDRSIFNGVGDSIQIMFDDTIVIFHGSTNYSVLRDIRKTSSFIITKTEDSKYNTVYEYIYTFTNADFEEAKTINGL